jgi:hypothetical protein
MIMSLGCQAVEWWTNSPKEKLGGRLAVPPIAQVEVEEYRMLARLLLQLGEGVLGLRDIRGSNVNGRILAQKSLYTHVISEVIGTRRRASTFAVSLPTLLFGLVIMTTLPVRSGRSSSFHLGFLSFSEPPRWNPEASLFEEDSGAGDDMEKRMKEGRGRGGN